MNKTLNRSVKNKVIGGVAGGLGEYFNIDPVLVRVLFVVSVIFHGAGILAYIILWIVLPEAPYVFEGVGTLNSESASSQASGGAEKSDDAAARYFKSLEEKRQNRNRFTGIVLIVLGCIFLADIFVPRIHFIDFWPLILIAIGASLLVNSKKN